MRITPSQHSFGRKSRAKTQLVSSSENFASQLIAPLPAYRRPRPLAFFRFTGAPLPGRDTSRSTAVRAMTAAMPRRASGMLGACVAPLYACISKPASTSAAEKG